MLGGNRHAWRRETVMHCFTSFRPVRSPSSPLPFFHESIDDDEVPLGITSMPTSRPDMIITVKLRRRRKKRRRRRESFLPRYMEGSSCLPGLTRAKKKKTERGVLGVR